MLVNLHISTREHIRIHLQAPLRKYYVVVELDVAEGLMICSPCCRIGHTSRILEMRPTMVITAAYRYLHGPDPSRKSKWVAPELYTSFDSLLVQNCKWT